MQQQQKNTGEPGEPWRGGVKNSSFIDLQEMHDFIIFNATCIKIQETTTTIAVAK